MTTLSQLRTSLRTRLEDTGGSPLYSDSVLNEYITRALNEYGRWAPLTDTADATVATDATTVTLPAGVQEHTVVGVRDGTGADVRPMNGRVGYGALRSAYIEQAWRVFDGALRLQRKVASSEAGTWKIDHLAPRPTPAADGDTLSIAAGDEPVVIELALAAAISQRSIEDYKRGDKTSVAGATLARETRDEARRMFTNTRRRARGSYMDVA